MRTDAEANAESIKSFQHLLLALISLAMYYLYSTIGVYDTLQTIKRVQLPALQSFTWQGS